MAAWPDRRGQRAGQDAGGGGNRRGDRDGAVGRLRRALARGADGGVRRGVPGSSRAVGCLRGVRTLPAPLLLFALAGAGAADVGGEEVMVNSCYRYEGRLVGEEPCAPPKNCSRNSGAKTLNSSVSMIGWRPGPRS